MTTVINLSTFIRKVRRHEADESGATVEEIARAILASNEEWDILGLDVALNGEDFENEAFNELVACPRIRVLALLPPLDANGALSLLNRALPAMSNHQVIAIYGFPMSSEEAKEIFKMIRTLRRVERLVFMVAYYSNDVINEFIMHVRECSASLKNIALSSLNGHHMTAEAFKSLCGALTDSQVLRNFNIAKPHVDNANVESVIESLTDLTVKGPVSFRAVHLINNTSGTDRLCQSLLKTDSVINSELAFRVTQDGKLRFDRNPWWRRLVAVDGMPLELWPCILEKANEWKHETSHSHLDILYYLIKEKSTELLQNVNQRRIRKRSRSCFESS